MMMANDGTKMIINVLISIAKDTVHGVKRFAILMRRGTIVYEPISTSVYTQRVGGKTTVSALPHTHQP